jgi:hypothetical protein
MGTRQWPCADWSPVQGFEYELGECAGEIPSYIAGFSLKQIRRECILGEGYGQTP